MTCPERTLKVRMCVATLIYYSNFIHSSIINSFNTIYVYALNHAQLYECEDDGVRGNYTQVRLGQYYCIYVSASDNFSRIVQTHISRHHEIDLPFYNDTLSSTRVCLPSVNRLERLERKRKQ